MTSESPQKKRKEIKMDPNEDPYGARYPQHYGQPVPPYGTPHHPHAAAGPPPHHHYGYPPGAPHPHAAPHSHAPPHGHPGQYPHHHPQTAAHHQAHQGHHSPPSHYKHGPPPHYAQGAMYVHHPHAQPPPPHAQPPPPHHPHHGHHPPPTSSHHPQSQHHGGHPPPQSHPYGAPVPPPQQQTPQQQQQWAQYCAPTMDSGTSPTRDVKNKEISSSTTPASSGATGSRNDGERSNQNLQDNSKNTKMEIDEKETNNNNTNNQNNNESSRQQQQPTATTTTTKTALTSSNNTNRRSPPQSASNQTQTKPSESSVLRTHEKSSSPPPTSASWNPTTKSTSNTATNDSKTKTTTTATSPWHTNPNTMHPVSIPPPPPVSIAPPHMWSSGNSHSPPNWNHPFGNNRPLPPKPLNSSPTNSIRRKKERNDDKDKGRGSYRCGRCGAPKKGHVCPYQPKLKRRPGEKLPEMKNASTQVEMDEFLVLRRLNLEIQGFPESYTTEPVMVDVGTEVHHPSAPPHPHSVPPVVQQTPQPPPPSIHQSSSHGTVPPSSTSSIPPQSVVPPPPPHMVMHNNSMMSTTKSSSSSNNHTTNNMNNDTTTITMPPPLPATDSRLSDLERTINETISNDLGMSDMNASYTSKDSNHGGDGSNNTNTTMNERPLADEVM